MPLRVRSDILKLCMHDKFFISAALREIGRLLEVKGDNPFKARAYQRAAEALQALAGDLDALIRNRRLTEISGIGSGLAGVIEELYRTGRTAVLEQLRMELPPGAVELSVIPGLSLKKMMALHEALRIENIPDLKTACEKGLVRNVKGFGQKAEAKILDSIDKLEKREERALLNHALEEGEQLLQHLRISPAVLEAEVAGSLRRRKETVRRIQLVVASTDPEAVLDHLQRFPGIVQPLERTVNGCKARLARDLNTELQVVSPSHYVQALHELTGSGKHLARLEEIAGSKGIPTASRGLSKGAKHEADIYRRLGMQYIPPELRDGAAEIEAALFGTLPELVAIKDIRGMVHCHTVYSDGKNTIEEMALAAQAMGMKYLTITDHSPSAFYARGVKTDRLKAQWDEIAGVQEKVKLKLLKGTESDILQDGALDYPDPILEQFDIIIASIHTRAKMDVDQMTRRILTAMKSPFFKVWGHPLGRLLLSREPLECHVEQILDAVAEAAAAIEVNGDPRRLDLEPRWVRAAQRRGIRFIVSTDAHSTQALANLRYGVFMARRGWLTREEVLNTRDTKEFMKAVHP
ncbi:MAG TPA: DNA polymerase/3'-5' exonuclease PolX [Candidatus Binatia bacterium]|nr:DNA polymerase/3'-5' exonuclease PolX [Candidatus Binatia bacterium]